MKFRKKPVVIEAVQVSRMFFENALEFIDPKFLGDYNSGEFEEDDCYLEIKTLEGTMTAEEGDWIIKGIKDEFYPCNPDIFEMTYEKVEEDE